MVCVCLLYIVKPDFVLVQASPLTFRVQKAALFCVFDRFLSAGTKDTILGLLTIASDALRRSELAREPTDFDIEDLLWYKYRPILLWPKSDANAFQTLCIGETNRTSIRIQPLLLLYACYSLASLNVIQR